MPTSSQTHDCIFCAIVAGAAPATFLHQDDGVVAFMDIRPVQPGHLLVVPRMHAELLPELDDAVLATPVVGGNSPQSGFASGHAVSRGGERLRR